MSRDKHGFDRTAISTEEADKLCSFVKHGEPSEWHSVLKLFNRENGREYTCGCGLKDDNGVALEGVRVLYQFLRAKKVNRYRAKATMFVNDNGIDFRVVQIENRQPVNKKGGKNHEDWPHLHYGQTVAKLGFDEGESDMSPKQTFDYFNDRANIELSPDLNCDFDNPHFELE